MYDVNKLNAQVHLYKIWLILSQFYSSRNLAQRIGFNFESRYLNIFFQQNHLVQ